MRRLTASWGNEHRASKGKRFEYVPSIDERQKIDEAKAMLGFTNGELLMKGIEKLTESQKDS